MRIGSAFSSYHGTWFARMRPALGNPGRVPQPSRNGLRRAELAFRRTRHALTGASVVGYRTEQMSPVAKGAPKDKRASKAPAAAAAKPTSPAPRRATPGNTVALLAIGDEVLSGEV